MICQACKATETEHESRHCKPCYDKRNEDRPADKKLPEWSVPEPVTPKKK